MNSVKQGSKGSGTEGGHTQPVTAASHDTVRRRLPRALVAAALAGGTCASLAAARHEAPVPGQDRPGVLRAAPAADVAPAPAPQHFTVVIATPSAAAVATAGGAVATAGPTGLTGPLPAGDAAGLTATGLTGDFAGLTGDELAGLTGEDPAVPYAATTPDGAPAATAPGAAPATAPARPAAPADARHRAAHPAHPARAARHRHARRAARRRHHRARLAAHRLRRAAEFTPYRYRASGGGTSASAGAGGATATAGGTTARAGADRLDWHNLAHCEASNRPDAVDPSGTYGGLYQFDVRTWHSVGGSGRPQDAPAAEQTARAKRLYAQRGSGPWPVCGGHLYQ